MLLPRSESLGFVTAMTDFKDMMHKADFVIKFNCKKWPVGRLNQKDYIVINFGSISRGSDDQNVSDFLPISVGFFKKVLNSCDQFHELVFQIISLP